MNGRVDVLCTMSDTFAVFHFEISELNARALVNAAGTYVCQSRGSFDPKK